MKILWLTNIPSPYRVNFFNELGKNCELTVLFEKNASTERDSSWKNYRFENFEGIILPGKSMGIDTAFCPGVVKYILDKSYNHIIVTNFTDFTGMLAISIMRVCGIKYWLESDGGFAKSGKGFVENVKKHFIKNANLYLSTGKSHDKYYLKYGATRDRIKRYPFSSVYAKDVLKTVLPIEKKQQLKDELGIQEQKVVVAIGQFIHRKGFDVLMDACEGLDENVGIYFIGGKPTKDYLDLIAEKNLKNIYFKDFMSKTEIFKFCKASDVFVLPTREDIWGLVINEAFASGLPVISTDHCGAAIELIKNGKNGYIVPVENSLILREKIKRVLNDNKEWEGMSSYALNTAHVNTIEHMVECHNRLFELYE